MIKNRALIIVFCLLLFFPSIVVAQEGYYRLGKEQLEFRLAMEDSEEATEKNEWEELTDLENKRFFVSKKVEIDTADVDGVLVEKSSFDDVGYEIIIYFKKESWNKVRDITNRNIKKHLGIVRRGKLFMAPVLFDAFDTKASIVGNINASTLEWFVKGFTLEEEPSEEKANREKEHEKFTDELVKKIEKNPDDIDTQMHLASIYMFGNPKDYSKAAVLYEKIISKQPSRTDILFLLARCYTSLKEYEKAIKALERIIAINPSDELTTRSQLADVYESLKQYDSATNELERMLKILNSYSGEDKDLWINYVKNKIKKLKRIVTSPPVS
ncbi:MAG: tetratricopeptide repeat protein [Nitrospirae bacterium]|nr:tetratricopeptide repeat protein [Nitrospirota bacterium]